MPTVAQVVLLSLAVLAMVPAAVKYRQRRIGAAGFLLWLILWAAAGTAIVFPGSTVAAARVLGIGRGADLALYLSVMALFYLLFRVYVHLERVDRQLTQIVRHLALRDAQQHAPADKDERHHNG